MQMRSLENNWNVSVEAQSKKVEASRKTVNNNRTQPFSKLNWLKYLKKKLEKWAKEKKKGWKSKKHLEEVPVSNWADQASKPGFTQALSQKKDE